MFYELIYHLRQYKTSSTVIVVGLRDNAVISNNRAYGVFSVEIDSYGSENNSGRSLGLRADRFIIKHFGV